MDKIRVQVSRDGSIVGSVELKTSYFINGVMMMVHDAQSGLLYYKWSPVDTDGQPTMEIGSYPTWALHRWDSFIPS